MLTTEIGTSLIRLNKPVRPVSPGSLTGPGADRPGFTADSPQFKSSDVQTRSDIHESWPVPVKLEDADRPVCRRAIR